MKHPLQMLPFRFRLLDGKVLLTNFVGDYLVISHEQFQKIISSDISSDSDLFHDLQANLIISSGKSETDIEILSTRYRTKKAFLNDFTSLHMVVTTLRCNQSCKYCHATAKDENTSNVDMPLEIAQKVAGCIMASPSSQIKVEFQGGECTLNMPAVRTVVETVKELNELKSKNIEFVICTNLKHITSDILEFLRLHNFCVSTSFDGPSDLHDKHRVDCGGMPTHAIVLANIRKTKSYIHRDKIGALMTATKDSLGRFPEIIDEYLKQGFNHIVFRAMNPYGRFLENRESLSYTMEEFAESFKEGLFHIIDLNKKGIFFSEGYTSLLLRRMLTSFSTGYVDLQSPAGAGISGVIYDYDGNIYACDEGRMLSEMGDETFCIGSVSQEYKDVFSGSKLKTIIESSLVETTPQCVDCAYRIWCGADPARHYATQGDLVGHKALSDFCKKHLLLFDFLVNLLETCDAETKGILYSWIGGNRIEPKEVSV